MGFIDIDGRSVLAGRGGAEAPVVYVVNSPEHPFDLAGPAEGLACTVVSLPVRDWGDALTPWPAAGLYREEPDFGGRAAETLAELMEAIPAVEALKGLAPVRRAICGYSLGGLFALYAFANEPAFDACACLSGSVWYDGWIDYLSGLPLEGAGRLAYLSLGTKEKRGPSKAFRSVEQRMGECERILRDAGCEVRFALGPGDHLHYHRERFQAGLSALNDFLK